MIASYRGSDLLRIEFNAHQDLKTNCSFNGEVAKYCECVCVCVCACMSLCVYVCVCVCISLSVRLFVCECVLCIYYSWSFLHLMHPNVNFKSFNVSYNQCIVYICSIMHVFDNVCMYAYSVQNVYYQLY